MKRILILSFIILISELCSAQSPQKISYQAVIRNTSGGLVTNHAVGIRISILRGSATGTVVYSETYNPVPQTNANGLVTIEIGSGTPVTGTFPGIDWSAGSYYLKTEADPAGGTSYTVTGTSQILSVPYALYSRSSETIADNSVTSAKIVDGAIATADLGTGSVTTDKINNSAVTGAKIAQGGATTGQVLKWNGTSWVPGSDSEGAGLTLPWSGTASSPSQTFTVLNSSTGTAIIGNSASGTGVFGMTDGLNGTSGVIGLAHALSGLSYGVRGESDSPDGFSGYFSGSKFHISGNTGIGTEFPTTKLDVDGQIRIRGGNPGAGKVLTSDATGLASWQINAIDPFISSGGITRNTFLTDHFIFGGSTLDNATGDADNMRFSFNKVKGAFRAGTVTSDRWNDVNVGIGSVAMGTETRASGNYSTALGNSTLATGNNSTSTGFATQSNGISSFSSGDHTIASGTNSVALGYFSTASGGNSFSMGSNTSAVGSRSVAFGSNTVANSAVCFVIGHYNVGNGQPESWNLTDPVFEIGIGYTQDQKKNAMTVLRNGNVGIGPSYPAAKLDIDGQIKIAGGNPGVGKVLTSDNTGLATWQTLPSGLWQTNGSNIYYNNGNVGIGTTSPAAKLDISAPSGPNLIIRDSNGSNDRPGIQFANNYIHYIAGDDGSEEIFGFYSGFGDTRNFAARLNIHGPASGNWGRNLSLTHDGSHGRISTDAGYLVFEPAGQRVGIGTDSPTQSLDVNGTLRVRGMTTGSSVGTVYRTADGTLITGSSDARLKENIDPLSNSLEKILQLNGVSFSWIDDPDHSRSIGFIAQDFEKVIPELVFTNKTDGYKGINYAEVSALLVEAVKEQQKQITEQQNQIDELKRLIEDLIRK